MTSIYDELRSSGNIFSERKITRPTGLNLDFIRPHLVFRGVTDFAGVSLFFQLQDSNGRKIKNSSSRTVLNLRDAITAANTDADHGYLRFDLRHPLAFNGVYRLALMHTGGYAFSEANHIGWAVNWELRRNAPLHSPNTGFQSEFDIELWNRENFIRSAS